jgi:hypothetical protein
MIVLRLTGRSRQLFARTSATDRHRSAGDRAGYYGGLNTRESLGRSVCKSGARTRVRCMPLLVGDLSLARQLSGHWRRLAPEGQPPPDQRVEDQRGQRHTAEARGNVCRVEHVRPDRAQVLV